LERERINVRFFGTFEVVPALENLADLVERPGIAGLERQRLAEVGKSAIEIPFLPLNRRDLAVQERAVRRARDRAAVGLHRFVGTTLPGQFASAGDLLLEAAEFQHLDLTSDVGQGG